jgi:diaminopropionate ammonia-lyase
MSSHVFANKSNDREQSNILPLSSPSSQIRDFHKTLPHYRPSPLISLPEVAGHLGVGHVLIKDESSRLGLAAFKILGASWATYKALIKKLHLDKESDIDSPCLISLDKLGTAAQKVGVILYAATDGNHGRAVARMARYLGIPARIFVPKMVDEEAKSKITGEGANVKVFDGNYDETVLYTKGEADKCQGGKGLLISDTALQEEDEVPAWIVEGYQTMFDEMEDQVLGLTGNNTITHMLTPVGVGSLAQAVVTHFMRASKPGKTTIVTVEPTTAACLKTSLESGEMTSVETGYTICTGMCCGTLSISGWPILKTGVDFAVVVEDGEVHQAIHQLASYDILAGPCGAACLAGLQRLAESELCAFDARAVIVLLCTEGKRGYELSPEYMQ